MLIGRFCDILLSMSKVEHANKVRSAASSVQISRQRLHNASKAGAFVLGRRAFAKVSAIEGIHASADLEAEFLKLEDAEFDARRDALAEKFGRS